MDEVQAAILLAKKLMSDPPGNEAKLLYAGGGYVPGANLPVPELVTPKKAPPPDEGMNPLALLGSLAGLAKNVSTVGQTVSSLSPDSADTATATTPKATFDPPSNFSVPAKVGDKGFSPPRNFQSADTPSLTNPKSVAVAKEFDAPEGVDPRLAKIMQEAINRSGFNVNLKSGFRPGDKRFHGKGLATDWTIIGDDGKPLADYQSPQTFAQYQQLADHARAAQMDLYPDLNDQFRWGGYFSGGKGKYGALDLMHFDLGGSDRLGMAGGTWDGGLTEEQARIWGLKTGKLYADGGAVLDLDRAKEARERAGGEAGPKSAYMPGVPRQVHAAGGKAAFLAGSKARDFSSKVSSRDPRQDDEFDPLTLHHGTQNDFDAFRASGTGTTSFMGIPVEHERHGIFMSESPEMAHGFANQGRRKGKVLQLHAAIKNPLWVHDEGHLHPEDEDKLIAAGVDERWVRNHLGGPGTWEAFDGEDGAHFVNALKAAGYDGMTFPEENPDTGKVHRTWVALHPNQVKSADENEGGYDPDDDRFRFAAGGKAEFLADKHPDVPDVLYHGTRDNFGKFDRNEIANHQLGFHMGELDHANHFANSEQGGNVMPLHARIKNPIRLIDRGGWSPWDVTRQLKEKGRITEEHANNVYHAIEDEEDPEERDQIVIDLLRNLGHDGIVYMNRFEGLKNQPSMDYQTMRTMRDEDFHQYHPDAKDSYIAFHPTQLKSATGNNGDFNPDDPDITKAEGGAVSMHGARLARTGINDKGDFWQRWQDHLTAAGNPNPGLSQIDSNDRVAQQAAKLVNVHRADAENSGIETVLNAYGRVGGNEVVRSRIMHDILTKAGIRPTHANAVAAYNSLPDPEDRAERASGGRTLNPAGMYSKAAEVARALPQATGTVDQMMAMLKKGGVKQAELENAGRPSGDTITRDELAEHFERKLPMVRPVKLGAPVRTPQHILDAQQRIDEMESEHDNKLADSFTEPGGEDKPAAEYVHHPMFPLFTQDEADEYRGLSARIREFQRQSRGDQTKYGDYTVPGGTNYQEHLLTYPKSDRSYGHWDEEGVLAHVRVKDRPDLVSDEDAEAEARRFSQKIGENWDAVNPNSQKHYIQGAREELQNKRPGKSLHVEEVQSDWAQKGRTEGFQKPITPEVMKEYDQLHAKRRAAYQTYWDSKDALKALDNEMKEPVKQFSEMTKNNPDFQNHPDFPALQAKMQDVFDRRLAASEAHDRAKEEFEAFDREWSRHPAFPGNNEKGVEHGPYVTNTQQWVDLALKHVMQEAVKGGYDRVSFSPGEANADHYDQRKLADSVHYDHRHGGLLQYEKPNDDGYLRDLHYSGVQPEELGKHLGSEMAEKLLSQPPVDGVHSLRFDKPQYVGGNGMIGFYNGIVQKAVQKHVQMHDPDAKMEPYPLTGKNGQQYTGFSFPITDKIRDSVGGGLPAFADGGVVTPKTNRLGLYSKAAAVVRSLPQDKGTVDQMLAMLKKAGGVKQPELERAGRPRGDMIDRESLAKHFEDAIPNLEKIKAYPKYQQYTLPGGSNYREHLITLQPKAQNSNEMAQKMFGKDYLSLGGEERTQVVRALDTDPAHKSAGYTSAHWDQPDVLAHVRMKDRVGPNGEKVLHIEEIQSDWAQDARKKGIQQPPTADPEALKGIADQYDTAIRNRMAAHAAYRDHVKSEPAWFETPDHERAYQQRENDLHAEKQRHNLEVDRVGKLLDEAKNGKPGVPDAPYIGNTDQWTQLALKHALQQATDGDYDMLAITPGAEQAKRYSLSTNGITGLAYEPNGQSLSFLRTGADWAVHPDNVSKERLGDYVGPEVAQRLLATEPNSDYGDRHVLMGEDNLSIGGEGMRNFYDKIVPKNLKALTGQQVQPVDIDGQRLHSIALDPETRNTIGRNMTAFQRGGIALERLRKSKTDRT